ncbi:phosphomannomutase [Corynebacterium renale]|uniref:phospho-sugar mutase n=1 Tax=Corynebacterium renale TaxID=1724 RepID=UPI000DA2F72B|nr:phospho-sugar mutase [Corynebacterium renale]SQG65215.1 phosphomannomutase [Corynebacterium renale]STC98354.1 phosphomannomutase [Corynebacterium renale]
MNRELHDKALAWLDGDPDPVTREQLQAIMDDEDALAEAFAGPLQFGTAGLRGEIGPGESRMNQAVVIRATYGLVQWLLRQVERPRVVIGCDARHGSFTFAEAAAEVVAAAGGEALLLPLGQPTPLTSFSVRHLDADAGIMVTASHNPAKDNGYKVYLGGRIATGDAAGVQIVPPADKEIAACIAEAPAAASIARSADFEHVDTREAYRAATAPLGKPAGDLKIVLTPMHGVGGQLALDTLKDAGFGDVTVVEKQFEPDPDFPTVAFPNPEEDGALDLAVATAVDVDADLIIALDPDADRCALAVPARDEASAGTPVAQGWLKLSGDETGALIGDYIARTRSEGVLATSIVSGRLLSEIARAHGHGAATTLTGFKWIGRTPGLVYGYEEAIGHCVDPKHVRDKDGISAAVVVATLVSALKVEGKTVLDRFDELAREHGLYRTQPLTFRLEDPAQISGAMERLRSGKPAELAGSEVVEYADLRDGYGETPGTDGILIRTAADDRVIIRPSGTEPKLKCYLEVVRPVNGTPDWETADARLDELSAATRKLCGF